MAHKKLNLKYYLKMLCGSSSKETTNIKYGMHDSFCKYAQKNKLVFDTKENSQKYLDEHREPIRKTCGERKHSVYYCKMCKGWHITTNSFDPLENDLKWWRILHSSS